jgi:hypothetical protein
MIFRFDEKKGKTRCKMADIRKGDIFYTVDGSCEGPLLEAKEDAQLKPLPNKPGVFGWGCKVKPRL